MRLTQHGAPNIAWLEVDMPAISSTVTYYRHVPQ